MRKLKPCPFCGGEAKLYSHSFLDLKAAQCRKCGCGTLYMSPSESAEAWNRRIITITEREKYLENLIADHFLDIEGQFNCLMQESDCDFCAAKGLCEEAKKIIRKAEADTNDK